MKILKLRKEKKITQGDLAKACGTTQQQVAKIEKGIVDPRLSTLRKIAVALDCEIMDLFWSKKEFLAEVNRVAKMHKLNMHKIDFLKLNSLCATEAKVPSFHPYWELLKIENNVFKFKEQ